MHSISTLLITFFLLRIAFLNNFNLLDLLVRYRLAVIVFLSLGLIWLYLIGLLLFLLGLLNMICCILLLLFLNCDNLLIFIMSTAFFFFLLLLNFVFFWLYLVLFLLFRLLTESFAFFLHCTIALSCALAYRRPLITDLHNLLNLIILK